MTYVIPSEIYPNTKLESFILAEGDTEVPRDIMVEAMVIINKSHSSDMNANSQTKVVKEYLSKLAISPKTTKLVDGVNRIAGEVRAENKAINRRS